jgi:bacterioferritin
VHVQGNAKILGLLGDVLANELTAINQYLLHGETCARWGLERLAARLREEAQEERGHADAVIRRILFLEGAPDLQRYHEIRAGSTVREQLALDLELERVAIVLLEGGIELARTSSDNGTEALLTEILVAEEHGVHWIEAQLHLMDTVGDQQYLAHQLR